LKRYEDELKALKL